jgi:hypothetical protein
MKRHPSDSNVSYNSTICGCLRLEQIVASRRKSTKDKKKHNPIDRNEILPSAENPGVDVNCSTSMILTAYCRSLALFVQRRTTLNGPLHIKIDYQSDKRKEFDILSDDFIQIV